MWNFCNRAGLPENVPANAQARLLARARLGYGYVRLRPARAETCVPSFHRACHQPRVRWNVRERACLPEDVPSNTWKCGTFATELAYPKTFQQKAGCQNRIEKSSFFVRRSRSLHFPGAKKPIRLMERDGTFSIGKTSNCNHLGAGTGGVTRRC